MQDATCSLKTSAVHHAWNLQNISDSGHHSEEPTTIAGADTLSVDQTSDRQVDVTLNAVASSLSRLALSTPDVSPPGLSASLGPAATSTYNSWPNDTDLFSASGFLSAASSGLPHNVSGNSLGTNVVRPSFSVASAQQQQRRAITGHAPLSVTDTFGMNQSTNSNQSFTSWTNPMPPSLNWLQANRTGAIPTRFGPVHHGRSMSVQNINMTGNPSVSSRKFGNQYVSRGGGIFGAAPSMSSMGFQGRGAYQPQQDQFSARYSGIDEKAILASLGQDVQSSSGLEAQWLDLIRSAVQEQVRGMSGVNTNSWSFGQQQTDYNRQFAKGKMPFAMLDGNVAAGSDTLSLDKQLALSGCAGLAAAVSAAGLDRVEIYSRKVFVGGLPPDIDEDEIMLAFRRFGPLVVDWPHKAESKSYFPPKGYCFLLFQDELSVQALVEACTVDDSKLYWCVSSPTMKDKPVQVRPWNLSDADFVMDGSQPLDPRKTVFVGGVPRPLRAIELAMIMGRLYGGVCYAGIDTDPELKYPKGAGRVAFSSQQSYIAAISARFVQLQHGDIDKRVEVKPYVLDDQICDECAGVHSGGKFAPFFCANVTCLQYYCEPCWGRIHSAPGREFHKPLVKEGADRPRAMPFRWC